MTAEKWDEWRMYQEYVRCGNPRCKSCPHGPYWYGYREAKGKTRKRYFGKQHPGATDKHPKTDPTPEEDPLPPGWDAIFNRRGASTELALKIIGHAQTIPTKASLASAFRKASLLHHPDRGGSSRMMAAINAAESYLRSLYSL